MMTHHKINFILKRSQKNSNLQIRFDFRALTNCLKPSNIVLMWQCKLVIETLIIAPHYLNKLVHLTSKKSLNCINIPELFAVFQLRLKSTHIHKFYSKLKNSSDRWDKLFESISKSWKKIFCIYSIHRVF